MLQLPLYAQINTIHSSIDVAEKMVFLLSGKVEGDAWDELKQAHA